MKGVKTRNSVLFVLMSLSEQPEKCHIPPSTRSHGKLTRCWICPLSDSIDTATRALPHSRESCCCPTVAQTALSCLATDRWLQLVGGTPCERPVLTRGNPLSIPARLGYSRSLASFTYPTVFRHRYILSRSRCCPSIEIDSRPSHAAASAHGQRPRCLPLQLFTWQPRELYRESRCTQHLCVQTRGACRQQCVIQHSTTL